jgi:hypothetical protein
MMLRAHTGIPLDHACGTLRRKKKSAVIAAIWQIAHMAATTSIFFLP